MKLSGTLCLIAAGILLWLDCGENTQLAGAGLQTGNAKSRIVNPDGTPAAGVKVRFFPYDADPRNRLAKFNAPTARMDSAITDANGEFEISLDSGFYNVLAATDTLGVYSDSIPSGSQNTIVDTLKPFGSLKARVRLYGVDDPRTVFVLALGTDVWTAPTTTGDFRLAKMAEGKYRIRVFTTLDNYLPLDTLVAIRSAGDDSVETPIYLSYIGIPVPSGLRAAYDTLGQTVSLSWKRPEAGRPVLGYSVYRKRHDSAFVRIAAAISDTIFVDSSLSEDAAYSYCVAVVDSQGTEGTKSEVMAVNFQNRLQLVTPDAPFGRRREHTSLGFGGKLWLIAGTDGTNLKNDIWNSTDGLTWTKVVDHAAFSPRRSHASVVFNNKMWVIGGLDTSALRNDIWFSTDGLTWTEETGAPGFSARHDHACDTLNGKIWLVGGRDSLLAKNDIWHSADGKNWILAGNGAFAPRKDHTLCTFQNKLWVMAGSNVSEYFDDVWSSENGVAWTEVSSAAAFGPRDQHAVIAYQNEMWVLSGFSAGNYKSDVWHSSNGVTWPQLRPPSDFPETASHTAAVFDGRVWIMGESFIENSSLGKNHVWTLK